MGRVEPRGIRCPRHPLGQLRAHRLRLELIRETACKNALAFGESPGQVEYPWRFVKRSRSPTLGVKPKTEGPLGETGPKRGKIPIERVYLPWSFKDFDMTQANRPG
jgi:hypothetical protein